MRRFPVCRVLAAASFLLPLVGAPAADARAVLAEPAIPAAAGAATLPTTLPTTPGLAVELGSVSPSVVAPGQPLVITGTLRNDTASLVNRPLVRVVVGTRELDSQGVQDWAGATGPAQGQVVGTTRLAGGIAPGASASFVVQVSSLASRRTRTYGALPLSVEAGRNSVRTFVGYQRLKQYEPLSLAWAVPLTLDPDPDLFGPSGAARESAWQQALAPGSRVSRVLDATQDAPVTWAIDPTLTPSLVGGADNAGLASSQEHALRLATQDRIRSLAARHTPWVLPDTDGDVGAVAGSGQGESLMRAMVTRANLAAQALGGRSDIAWPIDSGYSAASEASLRRIYRRPNLAGRLTSVSSLRDELNGNTPGAAQRTASGLPLLAFDDSLSTLLSRTTSPAQEVLSAQQFVAESAALLNELPGTQRRSILVVAPRSFNPDPASAQQFFAVVGSIPWLTTTTTQDQLSAAQHAVPVANAPVTRTAPSATSATGRPVLTVARVALLQHLLQTVHGVAQIRFDGAQFASTWTRAAEQLASTRWRAAPTAWNTLSGRIDAATRQTTSAVKVSAGNINFLAESGRLQITVTNGLDVPIENVKLTVAASNPRLRIDSQPSILRIGANSRATVNVSVTALAAGLVPLRTTLTTPDGTVIGQGADVQVRVTPTGAWIYGALGGVAVLVLLIGIVRTVRRRPAARRRVLERQTRRAAA